MINLSATVYVETKDLNYQIEGIATNTDITAKNTCQTPLEKTDIDELINIILSLVAAVGTLFTFYAIRKESKQQEINKEFQRKIISDLIRHFYRNKIVINAIAIVYKTNIKNKKNETEEDQECFDSIYASEEHLLKLKVLPEDLRFEKFNTTPQYYDLLHQLEIKFRNFNIEVETALLHSKNRNIPSVTKLRDLETLDFKMQYFVLQLLYLQIRMGYLVKDKKSKKNKDYKAIEKKFIKNKKKVYTLDQFYHDYNTFDENIKTYIETTLAKEIYNETKGYNKSDDIKDNYIAKVRGLRVESASFKNINNIKDLAKSAIFDSNIKRHFFFDQVLKNCPALDKNDAKITYKDEKYVLELDYKIAIELDKLSFIEFEK